MYTVKKKYEMEQFLQAYGPNEYLYRNTGCPKKV